MTADPNANHTNRAAEESATRPPRSSPRSLEHWVGHATFVDIGGACDTTPSRRAISPIARGTGFATLGTELAVGRTAIRLAATDNVFSPMADAVTATRNDVGLSIGVGFRP